MTKLNGYLGHDPARKLYYSVEVNIEPNIKNRLREMSPREREKCINEYIRVFRCAFVAELDA